MTATVGPAGSDRQREPILTTCRRIRRSGFTDGEAANLVALDNGLAIGSQPWRVRELTRLLFLGELASTHGEWTGTEDRASTNLDDGWRVRGRVPRYLDQLDGPITLLSLFQAAAGSAATLDDLAPGALRHPSASPETRREGA